MFRYFKEKRELRLLEKRVDIARKIKELGQDTGLPLGISYFPIEFILRRIMKFDPEELTNPKK
jgi:hypothetical protein